MLQAVLRRIGTALRPIRPGLDALAGARFRHTAPIDVTSGSFNGILPRRFSADGDGRLPALAWSGLPPGTQSLVVVVQDADVPAPRPLTHLILYGIDPGILELMEGEVPRRQRGLSSRGYACGRNGLGQTGWLPPSPPPGHGPHRYAFQVFALDSRPQFRVPPGRGALMRALDGHVLAFGQVIGTYERQ